MLLAQGLQNPKATTDDASVYNVRKLGFQENICKAFAEDKNAALLWRLNFEMGSFAKDCHSCVVFFSARISLTLFLRMRLR